MKRTGVSWLPLLITAPTYAGGDWVEFIEATNARLVSDSSVGAADGEEKDYAWGDVDRDGDIDLVVVRKQPFSLGGGRRNVLFLNEGTTDGHLIDGVLVDRTAEYAAQADDGGQGMLDETNDRDVALIDVNGDGWLDIVTATNFGVAPPPLAPKTISHPRVYINQGEIAGVWQGFVYEQGRIPTFLVDPNFAAVAAGDVTGDGAPDLYFVDYANTLEDRLLVNDGQGFFSDGSSGLPSQFTEDGESAVIADINGDGAPDTVKTNHLSTEIAYNDPLNPGQFNLLDQVDVTGPLFVVVGDLNNDMRPDLVIAEHGSDRYLLNQGINPNGTVEFESLYFPTPSEFAGNAVIADLDGDGNPDVLIADVDLELPGCNRRLKILHGLGGTPNVTFAQDVGNLPTALLNGVHDLAVFDVDGDEDLDLVIGRCFSTEVWINQTASALCPWDLDGGGGVGVEDLLALLAAWGTNPGGPPDFDGDGLVGVSDLLALLAGWGPCS